MTYGWFLIVFLIIPIVLLGWMLRHRLAKRHLTWIGALMLIALIYTTPWDNYLVATRVWWYDIDRVWGIRFGWVPLEEYLFFLLQPILTGLWTLALSWRLDTPLILPVRRRLIRWASITIGVVIWVVALIILLIGWKPGTYLGLELVWALPPILLQLVVGAHILWARRRTILLTLVTATLYLAAADGLAISSGVWTIDPGQSLGIELLGILPLEELVFFLLTNTLLIFTTHLLLAYNQMPNQLPDSLSSVWRRVLRKPLEI